MGTILPDLSKKGNLGYIIRVKDRTITTKIKTIRKAIGFIEDPKDLENDIVVESDKLNTALNNDIVEVRVIHEKKDEKLGEVVKIIERSRTTFVGTVEERNGKFGVVPDDKKLYIDFMIPGGAVAGDKVQVELTPYDLTRGRITYRYK